jgi:hypothetical protein
VATRPKLPLITDPLHSLYPLAAIAVAIALTLMAAFADPSYVPTLLLGLAAVVAMLLDGPPQVVLGLLQLLPAVTVAVGAGRCRRSCQR